MSTYYSKILKGENLISELSKKGMLSHVNFRESYPLKNKDGSVQNEREESAVLNYALFGGEEWEFEKQNIIDEGVCTWSYSGQDLSEVTDNEWIWIAASLKLFNDYGTSHYRDKNVSFYSLVREFQKSPDCDKIIADTKAKYPDLHYERLEGNTYRRPYLDFEIEDIGMQSVTLRSTKGEVDKIVYGDTKPVIDAPFYYVSKALPEMEMEYVDMVEMEVTLRGTIKNGEFLSELPSHEDLYGPEEER